MGLELSPAEIWGAVKTGLLWLGALYVIVAFALFLAQRSMIFVPDRRPTDLAAVGARMVTVQTADGLNLTGWYIAPQEGRPVAVLFHGNAGNINIRDFKAAAFVRAGMGFLFAEYRGYGGNPGKPHEKGLYADGRAYIEWLRDEAGIATEDIILMGESLGTGVAMKMAAEYPSVRAVILETPYTAFTALARVHYPLFPGHILMRDRFDNLSLMEKVRGPILILHGRRDVIVPYAQAEELARAGGEKVRFATFDRAGHNDLYAHGAAAVIAEFLQEIERKE